MAFKRMSEQLIDVYMYKTLFLFERVVEYRLGKHPKGIRYVWSRVLLEPQLLSKDSPYGDTFRLVIELNLSYKIENKIIELLGSMEEVS